MQKEFEKWAIEKQKIEKVNTRLILCKRGQIWIAKIGINIGNEISKDSPFLRPIIILETNIGGDLILIAPLTSQYNKNFERYLIEISHKNLNKKSFIQINQIKVMSKKRLTRDIQIKIPAKELNHIKKQLQDEILKPRLNEKTHSDMN